MRKYSSTSIANFNKLFEEIDDHKTQIQTQVLIDQHTIVSTPKNQGPRTTTFSVYPMTDANDIAALTNFLESRGIKYYAESREIYSDHLRNMLEGWSEISTVKNWKDSKSKPLDNGVYAFVYDRDNSIKHPVTNNQVISFGEASRQKGGAAVRIGQHVLAMTGRKSNMGYKYQASSDSVAKITSHFGVNIFLHLDKIKIFFRPHSVTDPDFAFDRNHSVNMETQAHAYFCALWGFSPPGNTRDKPDEALIAQAQEFLKSSGFAQR